MKKILLAFTVLFILTGNSLAASFESDELLSIDQPVEGDIYTASDVLKVNTEVNGDIFAAGAQVDLDGIVTQDAMIGGGEVDIKATIKDDLRVAGGDVRIDSIIEGDLLVLAGDFKLESNAEVKGDLILAVGMATIDGNVNGSIEGYAGQVNLNSTVGKDVKLHGVDQMTFGNQAGISGNLDYKSTEAFKIEENIVKGSINFDKRIIDQKEMSPIPNLIAGITTYKILSLLLSGLLMIWLFRYFGLETIKRIKKETGKSFGIGLVATIALPLGSFIALLTVIGIPAIMVIMATWAILLYIAKVIAAMLIGSWIIKIDTKSSGGRLFGSFALGVLIFCVVGAIPYLGWIFSFIFVLFGLGGIYLASIAQFKVLRGKKLI